MADSAKGKDPINPLQHQPPNLKTWTLKTSIHCEGCKKKVKKIVSKTPGVYSSDVDLKQQKVTVTGNIDVDTLISKLIKKTGKHAELWPEVKTEQEAKKQSKPKPKPKLRLDEKVDVNEVKKVEDEVTKEKPIMETSVSNPPEKNADKEAPRNPGVKSAGDAPSGGAGVVKEPRDKQMKPPLVEKTEENAASEKPKEVAEAKQDTGKVKETAVDGGAAEDGVNGNSVKKKKKKGQNGKQKLEETHDAINENQSPYKSTNHSLPRNYPAHMHGPPPSYHAPPVYTVSYNTTQYPSSSYGASYYAMPPPQHTEAYAYAGSNAEYQPSYFTPNQSQPSDTFQIFSDENPNACSLM